MTTSDIIDLHKKLSGRIKQYETHLDLLPPPEVLNEMRYALRAIVEILELQEQRRPDQQQLNHAVQKAYHALLCAYHDLVDGLSIDLTTILEELAENYLTESITVLGAKRSEIIDFIHEVNEKTAQSRAEPSQRKQIYEQELYDKYFERLLEYRKFLTGNITHDVVVLAMQNESQKKHEWKKYSLGIGIGLLGVLFTLVLS